MWHCLIIEDDAVNANYVAEGLRESGHYVTVCEEPAAALELALGRHWDVIVLDRMLPGDVDGLSILAAIRAAGLKTPVIVLSALAALDERVRGLKAGGDDYLAKPFALPELTARLEALIRRCGSRWSTCMSTCSTIGSSAGERRSPCSRANSGCWHT